jgi:hypothetical protein
MVPLGRWTIDQNNFGVRGLQPAARHLNDEDQVSVFFAVEEDVIFDVDVCPEGVDARSQCIGCAAEDATEVRE